MTPEQAEILDRMLTNWYAFKVMKKPIPADLEQAWNQALQDEEFRSAAQAKLGKLKEASERCYISRVQAGQLQQALQPHY